MTDYFYDPTATFNGDGLSPTHAAVDGAPGALGHLNNTPVLQSNDTLWIRRSTGAAPLPTTAQTGDDNILVRVGTASNVAILGWPTSNGVRYSSRPAAGTSAGWDVDSGALGHLINNVHVEAASSSSPEVSWLTGVSCDDLLIANLDINIRKRYGSAWSGGYRYFYTKFSIKGNGYKIDNCVFRNLTGSELTAFMYGITVRNSTFHKNVSFQNSSATRVEGCEFVLGCNFTLNNSIIINNTIKNVSNPTFSGNNNRFIGNTYTGGVSLTFYSLNNSNITENNFNFPVQYINLHVVTGCTLAIQGNGSVGVTATTAISTNSICYNNKVELSNFDFSGSTGKFTEIEGTNNAIILTDCVPAPGAQVVGEGGNSLTQKDFAGTGQLKIIPYSGQEIVSTTTRRDGGNPVGVQFNFSGSTYGALSSEPHGEYIYLDMKAGDSTVTMYGAHKSTTSPLRKYHVWFELDYFEDRKLMKTSMSLGELEADTSVWLNDINLTTFKITLGVTLTTDQVCPVRVWYHPEQPVTGYLVIDPKLVVVDPI